MRIFTAGTALPLAPDEWYPAGVPDVRARQVCLRNGQSLRVVEGGPPDGVPVLLLHGWGGSAYNFRRLTPLLAASGLRAVAVELPGHGGSDTPQDPADYTATRVAGAIAEVINQLSLHHVVVVGESLGGAVALDVSRAAGDRVGGTVLLASIGLVRIHRVSLARAIRVSQWGPRRIPRWAVESVLRRVYGTRNAFDAHDVDQYWAPLTQGSTARALMHYVDRFDWSVRDVPASVGGRMRVLLGERDGLVPAGAATVRVAQLPGAMSRVVEGAGHLLAEEVPDEVHRVVRELVRHP